ncbi:NUDIX domain-containing protein [Paraburkholderia sp. PREW-6R]|uniref:NUDIX hydrolase n=1 Tax=Paraburkholderia sp. PREW-6R TaxID=3141544 RepID=UPI0031F4E1CB
MGLFKLGGAQIEASLAAATRQYLAGGMSEPQLLAAIHDDTLDIGISNYPSAAFESARRETSARQYGYVLGGMTECRDLDSGDVHRFVAGDFYMIEAGTPYIQRFKQATRILFIRCPAAERAETPDVPCEIAEWAETPLLARRLDLRAAQCAPRPNSLKPAVSVAVLDSLQRLILVKRTDSGYWSMPGGTMELDESVETCAHREVLEETGALIAVNGIVGVYSDPQTLIAYSDGEVRREFSVLLSATSSTETLRHDEESTQIARVPLNELDQYPMVPSQSRRMADVLAYLQRGQISLR